MPQWIESLGCWLFEILAVLEGEPSDLNETGPPVLMLWDDQPQEWPWPHDHGGEG